MIKQDLQLCYGSMGQCKSFGRGCLKRALTRTGTGMFGSAY